MIYAKADITRCKGGGLCKSVCPKGIIEIDTSIRTSYGKGMAVFSDGCIGCKSCAVICPDIAITIFK